MDFKELLEDLKKDGLDLAEDAVKMVLTKGLEHLEKHVIESENKYDDLFLAVIPVIKPMLFDLVDKIDGEEG